MKQIAVFVVVAIAVTLSAAPARAIPGQTNADVMAWGKANAAFTGFDLKTSLGGTKAYRADVVVDTHKAEFSAHSDSSGTIGVEYVTFTDEADTWIVAGHKPLMVATIRAIYGDAYASDLASAKNKSADSNRE